MKLTNTMTGKKESFYPTAKTLFGRPKVGMYHCGPTVYNYPHIGNLRAYVFADSLKRLMLAHGFKVRQVINITDVGHLVSDADTGEDKMDKARAREGKSAKEIADFYTGVFMENLADLNIDTKGTEFPRATNFIKEQIAIVKDLEKKGLTYAIEDGIYFDTAKFPAYGKLGNINLAGLREGERIGTVADKRNPTDFALWKLSPQDGKKREQEWQSPWGVGFPGWHIECSAMAMSILGKTIDIHTGGIDHIPVHHNNEIAQSEGFTGRQFVRLWMHGAFLTTTGEKMAKSSGDFLTLASIKEKGFSPMDYRYFLLGARYSTPMNFTWEALEAARNANRRLTAAVCELPWKDEKNGGRAGKVDETYWNRALAAMSDDLDTPKVLALQWEILKDATVSPADKKATILKIDSLLGLAKEDDRSTDGTVQDEIPADVQALLDERSAARAAKDWKKSDELRDRIAKSGYSVKDEAGRQTISKS